MLNINVEMDKNIISKLIPIIAPIKAEQINIKIEYI